jgi:aspartyl protease family protein
MSIQKTGSVMMFLACVLGLGLMTLFFGEALDHQRNPNQSPESLTTADRAEVYLERNRQGHYVVSGLINNSPVEFLLDTGATDVVIPEMLARRLQLQRGRQARAMTANGPITVYETIIEQLKIGDITLSNVKASINPSMPPPAILLGMSALRQIEFLQKDESLTLRQLRQ